MPTTKKLQILKSFKHLKKKFQKKNSKISKMSIKKNLKNLRIFKNLKNLKFSNVSLEKKKTSCRSKKKLLGEILIWKKIEGSFMSKTSFFDFSTFWLFQRRFFNFRDTFSSWRRRTYILLFQYIIVRYFNIFEIVILCWYIISTNIEFQNCEII